MTPLMEFIIAIITLLVTNGAFFYSILRKIKKEEVVEKKLDNLKKQDDEWLELYYEEKAERLRLIEETKTLREKIDKLNAAKGSLELKNQLLTWFRCEVNNCPKRRPPHVFDIDGNELVQN